LDTSKQKTRGLGTLLASAILGLSLLMMPTAQAAGEPIGLTGGSVDSNDLIWTGFDWTDPDNDLILNGADCLGSAPGTSPAVVVVAVYDDDDFSYVLHVDGDDEVDGFIDGGTGQWWINVSAFRTGNAEVTAFCFFDEDQIETDPPDLTYETVKVGILGLGFISGNYPQGRKIIGVGFTPEDKVTFTLLVAGAPVIVGEGQTNETGFFESFFNLPASACRGLFQFTMADTKGRQINIMFDVTGICKGGQMPSMDTG